MSEELAEIIREEIRRTGPIPFSRWMELCLYHPQYGYYMKPGRKTGYGRDADFVTPPTLHPFMGEAVAKELADSWRGAGEPGSWRVVEFGGGEGDLARNALLWLDRKLPELARSILWCHAELSPEHQRHQFSDDSRIQKITAFGYGGGPFIEGEDWQAVIACEVVDAIPFEVQRWRSGEWQRLSVATTDSRFEASWLPSEAPPPWAWAEGAVASEGQQVIHHNFLGPWIADVPRADTLTMILIDYGRRGPLAAGMEAVRAYRAHAHASWLEHPGEVDLTASVDFSQTSFWANGFRETAFESLEAFLLRHGILDELNKIDRNTVAGASSYLRLRQLLLPSGMGSAFKVQRFDRIREVPKL
ncbi:MAG: SAM-dependent methyltransferase [Thermoplasmatota archaeon]